MARPIAGAKLKPEWKLAIAEGRMAVVSASTKRQRLTQENAVQRNELAGRLADRIVIAHASNSGTLTAQANTWASQGLQVLYLFDAR